jgi:serine protease Do
MTAVPPRGARARAAARRATAVCAAVCAAWLGACAEDSTPQHDAATAQVAIARDSAGGGAVRRTAATGAHGLPDFAALVARFGDAVVNVDVVGSRRVVADEGDDPLLEFFERFGVPSPEGRQIPERGDTLLMRGAGSGFIVSADGYILTNAHVVAEADEVTVRLTDRREFSATVVGSDARTDVAVLKIQGRDLPVVRIGRSGVRPGEWVLAIGSPFGLESTATAGIVSSTSRAVSGELAVPFIQTDVAVNPGNSGGPLFNLDGEVVGMNSMIFSETGGYMGISFAIPIDLAMDVRAQLVETGHVVRGRIGVRVQDVDSELARSFGLERPRGALVSQVERGGPAAKAGVRAGDVIVQVGEAPIERSADLAHTVARIAPGRDAALRVWRGGAERRVEVRVERLDEPEQRQARNEAPPARDDEGARLGLAVRPLTEEEKRKAGTTGDVVVEDVAGAAARAGLRPGDIILAVNGREVGSVRDLRAAAERLRAGDAAALLVERAGTQTYVPVRVRAG